VFGGSSVTPFDSRAARTTISSGSGAVVAADLRFRF
jgi:hypothetical protein